MTKISLIIPCYNCVSYADVMQGSILVQDWDNVEVILINDGSTDDTETVLQKWIEKFIKRGYEAKYVYKENGGVTSAINVGLMNFTGEYVCFLDHDDYIEPNYISTLAGFLDENLDKKWVRCDANVVTEQKPDIIIRTESDFTDTREYPSYLSKYLSGGVTQAIWVAMIRSSFLKSCLPTLSLPTGLPIQENPIQIPLAFYSEPAYIDKKLYRWHVRRNNTSSRMKNAVDKNVNSYLSVKKSAVDEILKLPVNKDIKELYQTLVFLHYIRKMEEIIFDMSVYETYFKQWIEQLSILICKHLCPDQPPDYENVLINARYYSIMLTDKLLRLEPLTNPVIRKKFIIYGYGRCGKYWTEKLFYNNILPEEIWDISTDYNNTSLPVPLRYPHFNDYKPEDARKIYVLTMVYDKVTNNAVNKELGKAGFTNTMNFYDSIKAIDCMCINYLQSKLQ